MTKPSVTKGTHLLPYGELSPIEFERLCLWLVEREGYLRPEHLGVAGSEQGRDVIAYRDDRRQQNNSGIFSASVTKRSAPRRSSKRSRSTTSWSRLTRRKSPSVLSSSRMPHSLPMREKKCGSFAAGTATIANSGRAQSLIYTSRNTWTSSRSSLTSRCRRRCHATRFP